MTPAVICRRRIWHDSTPNRYRPIAIIIMRENMIEADGIRDIRQMATGLVAAWLDVDPAEVRVEIEDFTPPAAVIEQMDRAKRLLGQATREQEEAGRLASDAVSVLVDELGLTLRDAGEILGISHQRVAQLHHRGRGAA